MDREQMIQELKAPLKASTIKKRTQGGMELSYIEGYHAINEANRIFGYDSWSLETVELQLISEEECEIGYKKAKGVRVGYRAQVRVSLLKDLFSCIERTQNGFGIGQSTRAADAHESAIKEAETDAMKRAFRTFGSQFGNALYDKEQRDVIDDEVEESVEEEKSTDKEEAPKKRSIKREKEESESPSNRVEELKSLIKELKSQEEISNFRSTYRDEIKQMSKEDSQDIMQVLILRKKEV